MKKIVIITGLTGSGKSGLAIEIAKKYNGEIISADSVQIYKGLDIGSAKATNEEMSGIFHHLIDIKENTETYNVGEFVEDCKSAIDRIIENGKLPIIVGGTGLYVKALLEGYTLGQNKSDLELRHKYEEIAKKEGNIAVWNELCKLDPEKAKTVHYNNLKRVIRYIELTQNSEVPQKTESILSNFKTICIGIVDDREVIYNKINKRVDKMIEMGLELEVKSLIDSGLTSEHQSMNSIGYKEWFDYYNGAINRQETIDLIKQHTRNYCKRQLTFLKTINNGLQLCSLNDAKIKIERFLND